MLTWLLRNGKKVTLVLGILAFLITLVILKSCYRTPASSGAKSTVEVNATGLDFGTIQSARTTVEELLVTPKTIVLLGPNAQPLLVAPNPAITNPELQRPAALGYSYSGPSVKEVTKRLDGVEEKVSRLDGRVTAINDTLTTLTKGVGELKDLIKKNEAAVQEWSLTAH